MRSQPRWRALVLVALLVAAGSAATAAGAGAGTAQSAPQQVADADLEGPDVIVSIHLAPDGSARWNVSARYAITTENESRAFDRLAREFERGENETVSLATYESLVEQAEQRTGREMALTDPTRSADRLEGDENTTGMLSLEFTWEGFAATTGDQLTVGDVFESWTLSEGQRLVIYPPERYGAENIEPGPDEVRGGSLVWDGPEAFGAGEPAIGYEAGAPPPTTDPPDEQGFSLVALALAAVGLLALAGAAFVVYTRRAPDEGEAESVPPTDTSDADADAGEQGGVGATGAAGAEPTGEAGETTDVAEGVAGEGGEAESADGDEAGSAAAGAAAAATDDESGDGVDPELLSDEERVERLLERNDGRMRQADIVEETSWSSAKVSQLLSSMADEGRIEKLRIGRENLISLPEEE